ncbi:MAG TPA: DUF6600 domain-containing protein, partial [Burkholderiaceae bacterium]
MRRLLQAFLATFLLSLSLTALADPPGRVGRVAEVQGESWLFDAETKEWQRVERNQPLTEGDRLRSGPGARISMQIGSTSMWLDEKSELEFSRLDDEAVTLGLSGGQMVLRARARDVANDYQVQTREGRFKLQREGLYRVDQLDRGSRAFAYAGELRFDSRADGTPPVYLGGGEQAEFWWADGPRVERMRVERDDFANWALAQSEAQGDAPVNAYVSPEMTGAEDLNRYGRWEQDSDYGPIWYPQSVAVDWAPYRDGRWAWVAPWGWTWVDAAPWGFAPFHYGRWVEVRGRWCWAP